MNISIFIRNIGKQEEGVDIIFNKNNKKYYYTNIGGIIGLTAGLVLNIISMNPMTIILSLLAGMIIGSTIDLIKNRN
ncbi:hypothetical protein E9840_03310 [Tissierella creatinini]|nr:hypothetical protein E9840_03310 [Tissierella creatinini]TJX60693.1 hypothetical protein E8P77_19745 [Soehngenia saccharolytica]